MLCWKRGLDALAGSVLLISSINCCRNDEGVRQGTTAPSPSSWQIYSLRQNRAQKWGLKPRMEAATRASCPSLGRGDMAWRQVSPCVMAGKCQLLPHCWREKPSVSCASGGRLVGWRQSGQLAWGWVG